MCDPITAGAMAAMAAGTGLMSFDSMNTQKKQQKARNKVAELEIERQRGYERDANKALGESLLRYTPGYRGEQREQAKAERQGAIDQILPAVKDLSADRKSAPKVVNTANREFIGESTGRAVGQARKAANLQALGDVFFTDRVSMGRAGSDIRSINSKAAGSARLVPFEQEAAANGIGPGPLAYLGALLKIGGGLGSMAGMSGMFAGAPAAAGYNAGGMIAPSGLAPL